VPNKSETNGVREDQLRKRTGLDATGRRLRARQAAHRRWENQDPVEGTKAARAGFRAKLRGEVIAQAQASGLVLAPDEIERRTDSRHKAFMTGMTMKAAEKRRRARS
jgi:hypothetical protein